MYYNIRYIVIVHPLFHAASITTNCIVKVLRAKLYIPISEEKRSLYKEESIIWA